MASLHRYILVWLSVAAACIFATEDDSEIELDLLFTEEPQDVIVLKGDPFVFNCSVHSLGDILPVNITWRKDGHAVHDARRYVLANGSLYFERIVRKKHGRGDEGFYECIARTKDGAIVSRSARLTIAAFEKDASAYETVAAVEGELVRLPCHIKAVPPGTVSWQKDKQNLPIDPRYTQLDSGVLQIERVIEADTGQYRCRVTNILTSKTSKEDELIIERPEGPPGRKPPDMLILPHDVTRQIGETVTLECAASGLPMPILTWTFQNGTAINDPRVDIVGYGNLRIRDLRRRDFNIYKCTATNPANTQQTTSVLIKLIIIEAPRVLNSTPSQESQLSDTVRINCEFSGYPSPKVTVFKDAVYSQTTTDEPSHQWVITYLDDSHCGYYQCRAENEAGQVTTTMRLKIKPSPLTPDKPQNLRALVMGPKSLFVEWDPVPPKNGEEVMGYSVHYCNVADGIELQSVSFKTSIELKELTPYSNISIYVLAYNHARGSSHSDKIYQLIGEDVPIAGPTVTVRPVGASSLKLTWEKLPMQKARGVITEYDIYYREESKDSTKVETVTGDVHEYTLSGLTPNMPYEVRVMGKTSKGFPQLSDDEWPWVTAYTNSQHDVLEPPTMQVYALNQTAVQVRWQPTSNNKQGMAGYRLDVLSIRDVLLKPLIFTTDRFEDTVTGLEPDTLYKISLRCLGTVDQIKQEGEATVRNVKTLKVGEPSVLPTAPPPPQDLDVFPLNQSAVRFQWYRPEYTTGISFYTLRYAPVHSDLTQPAVEPTYAKHIVTNDNETLERLIGGLRTYTFYEFSVRTHTAYSFGAFSNVVRCRTNEGLPSAPAHLRGTLRGPGCVELTWEPPLEPNGIISHYLIHYRENTEPAVPWQVKIENGTSLMGQVDNLELEIYYNFQLKARTSVGVGPGSAILRVRTQNPYPEHKKHDQKQVQRQGIIIGVTITAICIIICIVLIVLRNRCCRPQPAIMVARLGSVPSPNNTLPIHFNGTYMPNANGNRGSITMDGDAHTMETLTPMLPPLVENENSDSKGGGRGPGIPGLRVQCMPNGQVATFLANQDSHNEKQQNTCLMGNGRCSVPVEVVTEGSPDISRSDPPMEVRRRAGHVGADDDDDDDDGDDGSGCSRASASTCSQGSHCVWPHGPGHTASTEKNCHNPKCGVGTPARAQCLHPNHKQHTAATAATAAVTKRAPCASGKMYHEEGDGDIDAVAEETESSRLLSHHLQHTTQPSNSPQHTQSTQHRSSLIEYPSSPPQSRYGDSASGGLASSDGDTSGTPLLCGTRQEDLVQFVPGEGHLEDGAPSDSPHA